MQETRSRPTPQTNIQRYDVVVIGAGFAGMYMLHFLRQRGFKVQVLEKGVDVGGTWYWNRYPGARCDVESMAYSYSFDDSLQQDWHWPHRYAYQPDILHYAQHVAARFDLRSDIQFNSLVTEASFDDTTSEWTLVTNEGHRYVASYCVMATGCLSVPKSPDIPGVADFKGNLYHTADWPIEGVDFSGRRVGVVGTGSSGIQCIPVIAQQAARLTVFQRTPNFSVPSWNAPITAGREAEIKQNYNDYREKARNSLAGDFADEGGLNLADTDPVTRTQELEQTWLSGGFDIQYAFADLLTSEVASETAGDFVHNKIRQIVSDPKTADLLCPRDHPIGTKRLCVDDAYFETYNRKNVSLVDLRRTPIDKVTAHSVQIGDTCLEFDDLVLATGFDAMTGALSKIDIRGRDGCRLSDHWAKGPRSYLGLAMAGFPNLFTVTGPGSPSVLTNMLVSIELHVEWIGNCLVYLRQQKVKQIEATVGAETGWVNHVRDAADATLYPRAQSWYVGANVPGKARIFMAYVNGHRPYRDICNKVTTNDYQGFELQYEIT